MPCRLIAALDVGNTLAFVSPWERFAFVSLWDRFWSMVGRLSCWSLDLQIDQQGQSQLPPVRSAAEPRKCKSAMATRNEAAVLNPVIAYRVLLLHHCVHSSLAARRRNTDAKPRTMSRGFSLMHIGGQFTACFLGMSAAGRLCCKSLKTRGNNFLAGREYKSRSLVHAAAGSLPRSPVSS